jgi:hypothetical protein
LFFSKFSPENRGIEPCNSSQSMLKISRINNRYHHLFLGKSYSIVINHFAKSEVVLLIPISYFPSQSTEPLKKSSSSSSIVLSREWKDLTFNKTETEILDSNS